MPDSQFGITDPMGFCQFVVDHFEDAAWEAASIPHADSSVPLEVPIPEPSGPPKEEGYEQNLSYTGWVKEFNNPSP